MGSETAIGFVIEDTTVRCRGDWTAGNLHEIESSVSSAVWPADGVRFDLTGISSLDTVGAWILHRTIHALDTDSSPAGDGAGSGRRVQIDGASEQTLRLLELIGDRSAGAEQPPRPYQPGILETAGMYASSQAGQYLGFLGFIGNLAVVSFSAVLHPSRIRWPQVVKELQAAGVNALPIVGLLTFLIGLVIAYQGGMVLRDYGANIYVADIVGLSMVRELSPLITAIIVAGRTGSAYTAQIGTMMVTEEVDALRSMGIVPLEMLVLPKLIALVIALPLLTVFADGLGLFGGMIMADVMLDVNPVTFVKRLAEAATLDSYLSGVGKAPVFAAIIAAVGCFQGFQVHGSAGSVGRQTTVSVVESIFLVIVVDAGFSVAFAKMGI